MTAKKVVSLYYIAESTNNTSDPWHIMLRITRGVRKQEVTNRFVASADSFIEAVTLVRILSREVQPLMRLFTQMA